MLWLTMAGMALVTYALRASFLLLPPGVETPALVRRALRYVPAAVLTAIWAPELAFAAGNAQLAAGVEDQRRAIGRPVRRLEDFVGLKQQFAVRTIAIDDGELRRLAGQQASTAPGKLDFGDVGHRTLWARKSDRHAIEKEKGEPMRVVDLVMWRYLADRANRSTAR